MTQRIDLKETHWCLTIVIFHLPDSIFHCHFWGLLFYVKQVSNLIMMERWKSHVYRTKSKARTVNFVGFLAAHLDSMPEIQSIIEKHYIIFVLIRDSSNYCQTQCLKQWNTFFLFLTNVRKFLEVPKLSFDFFCRTQAKRTLRKIIKRDFISWTLNVYAWRKVIFFL